MPPTVSAVGFVLGGVVGWISNDALKRYAKKKRFQQVHQHHVQDELASTFNKDYETQTWNYNWDNRAPNNSKDNKNLLDENNNLISALKKPRGIRHILLIRHGQYNMKGESDKEHTLTKLGFDQASQTGKRLARLDLPITKMIVSTMMRASQTADSIQKHLPSMIERVSTDLLREGAPFPPEPYLGHWKPDDKQFLKDGRRIEEGFKNFFYRPDEKQERDSFELVVCHANVIRYMVCRALQLPPEAWGRISLKHASITWISIRPSGRVTLRLLGDSGFMPPSMLTA